MPKNPKEHPGISDSRPTHEDRGLSSETHPIYAFGIVILLLLLAGLALTPYIMFLALVVPK